MQAPNEALGIVAFLLLVAGLWWACEKLSPSGRATGKTGRVNRAKGGK